jgi:CheY-like chemotaxis protein
MSGESILVIDDNAMNLKLAQILLERLGYSVRTASNGIDAVADLETTLVDLILLDIQMPHVNGFELIRRLRANERTRAIPVVAVTAYAMSTDEAEIREAGFDDYVSKPIDRTRLRAAVERQLARTAR